MRRLVTTLVVVAALGLSLHASFAGEAPRNGAGRPSAAQNQQRQRMANCNAEANQQQLKGDSRQSYMRQCLSASPPPVNRQQQRMKQCNAAAETQKQKNEKHADFMKRCLAGND